VRFVRESLAEILERDALVTVVRLCADLSEAVAVSPALEADVVLFDATAPGGTAAVKRAIEIAPGMRIIWRVLWGRATRKADAEAQRATPLKPD
jgi:DNA-binding NarL/FixJ family response regulator